MPVKVCIAGVTGWVGRELATAILADERFELVGAVSRSMKGKSIREALNLASDVLIKGEVAEALADCEVFVDYTSPLAVKKNVKEAMSHLRSVVIGTSGLTDTDLEEIGIEAEDRKLGVFIAGNFALTAVLLQECARLVAKYVKHYEVIDYAPPSKIDAPSGTARETLRKLREVQQAQVDMPVSSTYGVKECRGGNVHGAQVHSVRLPSFHFGFEVIFGAPHERLILKHEAGSSAAPYVGGTLLAIEKVKTFKGLRRGLQTVLEI